jgi:hypothetical protein
MTDINLTNMHTQQLYQLTGCKYASLVELTRQLTRLQPTKRVGGPFAYPVLIRLIVALNKLRGEDAYRTLSVYLGVSFVTLHR